MIGPPPAGRVSVHDPGHDAARAQPVACAISGVGDAVSRMGRLITTGLMFTAARS
jgi:hypothetical protein